MIKLFTLFVGIFLITSTFVNPVFAIDPLDRVKVTDAKLVNAFGIALSEVINVNQQVQVSTNIENKQEISQKFIYIVQIKNDQGVVISLGWFSGSLGPWQNFNAALSWLPENPGSYTAEIFVWKNLIVNQEALSEMKMLQIIVS